MICKIREFATPTYYVTFLFVNSILVGVLSIINNTIQ